MSETKARLISGFSLGFVYIFCIHIDHLFFSYHFFFFLFAAAITSFMFNEFCDLYYHSTGIRPNKKTGLTLSFAVLVLFYLELLKKLEQGGRPLYGFLSDAIQKIENPLQWVLFVFLCMLFTSLFIQTFRQKMGLSLVITAITLFGSLYASVSIAHMLLVAALPNGIFYIWLISFATIASDAMAYFVGKYMGKNKIGFAMSPNKTYEGYIGGFIAQWILLLLFYYTARLFPGVPDIGFFHLSLLSVMFFLVTALGDIVESVIKRDLHVKDSGKSISGHGGLLDLGDGLILTTPCFYYFYLILYNAP